jgi:signal transduction histidine kinase
MNKILERQLKKVFGSLENVPEGIGDFIALVSDTYEHANDDRLLTERSLDISSKELSELNTRLQKESAELKAQSEENEKSKLAVLNLLEDLAEEKKKVEQTVIERTKELSEEKARLLASINSLSFGFLIVSLDHNVILKNRAFMDLFGFGENDQIAIKDISLALGGFDLAKEAERCLGGSTVCEIKEIVYKKKILRGLVAPIAASGDSEKKIGYVLLFEDITEAKVMERSRDEFFAVASHELRTPLTAIRGNAEMIMETFSSEIKDKDMKEMLVDIDNSSIRLIDIVNDFLEVSRLEQGRVEIKKERFDVSAIVLKVIKDLKSMAETHGIYLKFTEPKEPLPEVMADKNRVEQVLMNLIGNSLKFTAQGGITVSIEKLGVFIKVRVTDTGLGISEKNQSLLFRKFQQAGENMIARDVTQGTGLGLYICHQLISRMGGTIGVESSELGKGSTFSFTVPVAA